MNVNKYLVSILEHMAEAKPDRREISIRLRKLAKYITNEGYPTPQVRFLARCILDTTEIGTQLVVPHNDPRDKEG